MPERIAFKHVVLITLVVGAMCGVGIGYMFGPAVGTVGGLLVSVLDLALITGLDKLERRA